MGSTGVKGRVDLYVVYDYGEYVMSSPGSWGVVLDEGEVLDVPFCGVAGPGDVPARRSSLYSRRRDGKLQIMGWNLELLVKTLSM